MRREAQVEHCEDIYGNVDYPCQKDDDHNIYANQETIRPQTSTEQTKKNEELPGMFCSSQN